MGSGGMAACVLFTVVQYLLCEFSLGRDDATSAACTCVMAGHLSTGDVWMMVKLLVQR